MACAADIKKKAPSFRFCVIFLLVCKLLPSLYFAGVSTTKMVLTIDRTFEKALHDKDSQKYMTFERDVIEVVRILCIPILFVYY